MGLFNIFLSGKLRKQGCKDTSTRDSQTSPIQGKKKSSHPRVSSSTGNTDNTDRKLTAFYFYTFYYSFHFGFLHSALQIVETLSTNQPLMWSGQLTQQFRHLCAILDCLDSQLRTLHLIPASAHGNPGGRQATAQVPGSLTPWEIWRTGLSFGPALPVQAFGEQNHRWTISLYSLPTTAGAEPG